MPIHDWSRVDAGTFHDFHTSWLFCIKNGLNNGGLPAGFYAHAERHMGRFTSDVPTLTDAPLPSPDQEPSPATTGGLATATRPPQSRLQLKAGTRPRAVTVAVRMIGSRRLVALIEIASLSNKNSASNVDAFVRRAKAALDSGVHVVLLDILPATKYAPTGLSGAVCDALDGEEYPFAGERPFAADSYCVNLDVDLFANPLAVGDELPVAPLFLTAERYVDLPLAGTYAQAFQSIAPQDRDRLAAP